MKTKTYTVGISIANLVNEIVYRCVIQLIKKCQIDFTHFRLMQTDLPQSLFSGQ